MQFVYSTAQADWAWVMWNTPSLLLLSGPLWPGDVTIYDDFFGWNRDIYWFLKNILNHLTMQTNELGWIELLVLNRNTYNHLTVFK